MTTNRGSIAGAIALLAIPVAVAVVLPRVVGAGPVDDMFIFARYAENLASGHGAVFNPGDRVEGYSSPLWMLSLAAAAVLKIDVVFAATVLGELFALAATLLVFWEAWSRLPPSSRALAIVPATFLASSPPLLWYGRSGMETAAVTFLLALSLALFRHALARGCRFAWAGTAFALAVLARPDALAVLPVLVGWAVVARRADRVALRRTLLTFLAPLSLIGVHLVWRSVYYGAFLPNTYFAKAGVPLDLRLNAGLHYAAGFARAYWIPLVLVAVHGVWRLTHRSSITSVWIANAAILVSWVAGTTWVGGDHFPMLRFYVPLLPVLAFGFTLLLEDAFGTRFRPGKVAVVACCVLSLAGIAALNHRIEIHHGGEAARGNVELAERWAEVGRWMARHLPRDSSIGSIVVGAIPYYSKLQTYDLLGLVDRTVATEGRIAPEAAIGHQKYHTDYILRVRPDYIVFNSSGLYERPLRSIGTDHAYALYDLANDPRTRPLYTYRAIRMENGRYIELLESKGRAR